MCARVYMYVCARVYVHMCVRVHEYAHVYVCMCARVCTSVCVCVRADIPVVTDPYEVDVNMIPSVGAHAPKNDVCVHDAGEKGAGQQEISDAAAHGKEMEASSKNNRK